MRELCMYEPLFQTQFSYDLKCIASILALNLKPRWEEPLWVYLYLVKTENLFGYATQKSNFDKQSAKAIEKGIGFC